MNKELFVSSTPHETRVALAEDGEIAEVYYEREKEYSLAGAIYKGRVTRVLPGMQSAFVDIGLERDAFLYVSDFFEDSDEYDRVVSEAENAVARLESPAPSSPVAPVVEAGEAPAEAALPPLMPQSPLEDSKGSDQRERRGEAPECLRRQPSGQRETDAPEDPHHLRRGRHRGGRRGGRRDGGGIPDSKFARPGDDGQDRHERPEQDGAQHGAHPEISAPLAETSPELPAESVTAVPVASAAFVLPGESLAKYRAHPTPPPPPVAAVAPPPPPAPPAPVQFQPEPPPPPAVATVSAAAAAFVLPGESLAKYRDRPAPPPVVESAPEPQPDPEPVAAVEAEREVEAAPSEDPRERFEHERSQPDSPPESLVDLSQNESEFVAQVLGMAEADADAADDDLPPAPGEDAAYGDDGSYLATDTDDSAIGDDASAAHREPTGEARLQAPARPDRDGRDGRGRGRGGRRRRGGRGRGDGRGEGRGESRSDGRDAHARDAGDARPRDARPEGRNDSRGDGGPRLIGDLLHPGQEILIQIAKEPIGKKGARITSHLALPGRFLVYMPTVHHIGVSRKIASDEERARLKRLILENSQDLPGGFIVRTAGAGASDEEFKADIRLLANLWTELRRQFDEVRGPALLHHDLDLVERILRDQLSTQFTHIWVDGEDHYQRIVKFVGYFMPQLADRVRLYTRETPMFEHFGIQAEIDKALQSKVWLKSGGYIVLNQTEALVAIDVNTGKYVGRSNRLEDTIVKTNVDAIKEIVRQIRLRDLGGIIVIDFIDMDERRNRQRVMQALEEAMRADRAPSKVLAFNDFGLVALTRKRVKQSLERTLGCACPYCDGVGLVKSPVTVCNEIYSEVKKVAPSIERDDLVLRVHPEIAKHLKAQNAQRLREMEDVTRKAISVRPDPAVHQVQFEIY